ncbi:MAG: hypothetical protein U1E52_10630 [Geminicoccaceae bacterium]
MFKRALGVLMGTAVLGLAGVAAAQDATTAPAPTYYPPYPLQAGRFVDNPYYKYYGVNKPDECYFDFNTYDSYPEIAGYNVKIKRKVIVEKDPYTGYPVYYILITGKCAVGTGYKAKKRIVYRAFPCSLTDNTNYEEEEDDILTYDSKFVVKKGAKYGNLSCKFKVEKDPYAHGGEPVTEDPVTPVDSAPTGDTGTTG